MSSSSVTASGSRSPSPRTPDVSDSSTPIIIHTDHEPSWYQDLHPTKSLSSQTTWASSSPLMAIKNPGEEDMLRLDELLESHAYEDSPSPEMMTPVEFSPMSSHLVASPVDSVISNFRPSNLLVPSHAGPVSLTKPIPPPAAMPRKADPSMLSHRVVRPPKESCFNLPIMFPSIPEGGTKSRVETQVRVTVDLADASSSSDPYRYARVGSWKWLKLPHGTATKRRTRKQGKIDPDPQEILHLSANVTCASPPHNRVLSCSSCQAREAKRVAKKLAARVRPARSDSESGDERTSGQSKHQEDTTSIIQFNCAEVLDFSTGSVVLPLRITCYCRHHREKVGFNVHFTLMDQNGRIVGTGSSRPIMITDDHKTVAPNQARPSDYSNGFQAMDTDWSRVQAIPAPPLEAGAPSKRKKDHNPNSSGKKRAKPYDSSGKPTRPSREGSISSIPSPLTPFAALPLTRSPSPHSILQQYLIAEGINTQTPALHQSSQTSDSSSPDTLTTPLDQSVDVLMPDARSHNEITHHPSSLIMATQPHPIPFMFFDPSQTSQSLPLQLPTIHRLIPNMGPTHGGIEVTILGANFHASLQLNCLFGDVVASSTHRWSDNALVCLLPPRASAGVVAVSFDGFPKTDNHGNSPPSLFTYSDESDRALMELALQVVGLKMTGKIEDAKNVAMRIVGNAGNDNSESHNGGNTSNMMQVASLVSPARDLRSLLFFQAGEREDFETLVLDFLAILDTPLDAHAPHSIPTSSAISHSTPGGQTLLHLAAFLGFSSLVKFLTMRGVDLDARDRNGYTALHFAALSGSKECAQILLSEGADREIVNASGRTPEEIAPSDLFDGMYARESDSSETDEEAQWGDAEEEGEVQSRRNLRRTPRRGTHQGDASGKRTPQLIRSLVPSRAATPPIQDMKEEKFDTTTDAKHTASIVEMIQRTLAQFPAAQGIIPNLPQLPLPQLPQLPGMPAVPWGALPQIPMVFPVFVPMMPGWPAFLGGETPNNIIDSDKFEGNKSTRPIGAGTTHEWWALWEKWIAAASATMARQQAEDMPPPVYTPRATENSPSEPSTSSAVTPDTLGEQELTPRSNVAPEMRPVGYGLTKVTDQEVNSFAYQPPAKRTQKRQQKHDRMLLLFWLPILLISLLWGFHHGLKFIFHSLKTTLPKYPLRT